MKILDQYGRELVADNGHVVPSRKRSLPYTAANQDRLSSDWPFRILTADAALRTSLRLVRARSRDLERNDNVGKAFGKAVTRNVLGSDGIGLQMKVKNPDGSPDKVANRIIEEGWDRFGSEKLCDVSRKLSWKQLEKMALLRCIYDGETLAEAVGDSQDNPFRIAYRIHESDLLDENYNTDNGATRIIMSVEVDSNNRPVRYWLLNRHPGEDYATRTKDGAKRVSIAAESVVHLAQFDRPTQTRGVPWLSAGMVDVRMLNGYKEAELVAARVSASKAGFITKDYPDGPQYPEDSDGNLQIEVSPGVIEELPMGANFTPYDPTHPNQAFGDFIKAVTRSIASGLGISYSTISGDLESVNYSSIRAGVLEEREEWKQIQSWMITDFHRPLFRKWLESALRFGALGNLPYSKLDKFLYADTWCGRRWPWVDPEKDIRAALMAVDGGLRSRRRIVAESDAGDFEDVLEEIRQDNEMAKESGVQLIGANGPALTIGIPNQDPNQTPDTAAATGVETVQDTALNGAQMASLQQIIQAVAMGQMPEVAAMALIEVSLPGVDLDKIKKMVSDAASFTPKPLPTTEPVAKTAPAK